ncbi:MAG: diacylglycerol kinase family protein, partial [Ilumatobacteraceae bacterium]
GLQDAIAQLVDGGVDAIAAVGGDGTQRTVAAELLDGEVALAVIPGGTVNLLAQVLGVDDVDEAVRVAATGETRIVDVGLISCDGATDDVFVLNASSGWDAAVIEQVGDGAKRFGRLGFVAAGLAQWFRTEPTPVTIDVDGRRWYADPALTVLVMNVGQRGSASLDLAPDAEFDDGRLDVIVLRRHSTIGLVRAGWRIIRGRPASTADVVTAQGAEIVVAWGKAVATQRDGDERASTDRLRYRSVPGGLRVMVPSARS